MSTPEMKTPSVAMHSKALTQSSFTSLRGTSGRWRRPNMASTQIGRFTAKIHGQGATDRMADPMVGPSTDITATVVALMLMPRPSIFRG
ncbi:hypothetical protein G6F63_015827 [Rhizopus arrhizus]|nr:hypothetical protein G6F63_015827 [Rhizopus arrhizus]